VVRTVVDIVMTPLRSTQLQTKHPSDSTN
jgi:hypothetical protein